VAENPQLTDTAVDAVREYSKQIAEGEKHSADEFCLLIESKDQRFSSLGKDVTNTLYDSATAMAQLIKKKHDTIWGFIMKNYYKPIFLSQRKFDCLVGNPPWLSYRYVKSTEYQQFLKDLIVKDYALLSSKEVELITQMELATLFFVRCTDFYLRDGGTIGFVMPRSVFVSDQHDVFRSGSYKKVQLGMSRVMDLEKVTPLFNVPSSVLIAIKSDKLRYPVSATILNGTLPRRNARLSDALANLSLRQSKITLQHIGERSFLSEEGKELAFIPKKRSEYFDDFKQGACTVPRSLWAVDIVPHAKLGIDTEAPYVRTSKRALERAKAAYSGVNLKGQVESHFLYASLSGSELLPFGFLSTMVNVLPIESGPGGYLVIERSEVAKRGFAGLSDWLRQVESAWKSKRGEKATKQTVYEWLDYQGKLSSQTDKKKFKVLYNTSGTYLVSCVVENRPIELSYLQAKIKVKGVIADWTTYWFETDNEDEAYYLCACLNSPIIDEQIKPMQAKGAFGERHIVKKPLEFPIPKFDVKNASHKELSKLGRTCSERVERAIPALAGKYSSVGIIRREIKNLLKDELEQMDKLVRKILKAKSASKSASDLRNWTKE